MGFRSQELREKQKVESRNAEIGTTGPRTTDPGMNQYETALSEKLPCHSCASGHPGRAEESSA